MAKLLLNKLFAVMKRIMLIGGIGGFLIGMGLGMVTEGSTWSGIFLRSAIATLFGGVLLRWWGENWVQTLREVHEQRMTALAKAQEINGPKAPWKK
jgi:hypothetical protein